MNPLPKSLHDLAMTIRQVGRLQVSRLFGSLKTSDGRYKAAIDLLERSLFLRAEVNALTKALISKGVLSEQEWGELMHEEFRHYAEALAEAWPEVHFDASGFTIKDISAFEARVRAERWPQ